MKKYDAMRLSGTILLAHLALCAAFLLLLIAASGSTSTFTFRSPYGLVLGLLFIGLPAFAFGCPPGADRPYQSRNQRTGR